jgi:hypothetical protein
VLLGVPIWLAARGLLSRSGNRPDVAAIRHRAATLCVGAVLAACALVTEYPRWDREPFFWPEEPRGAAIVAAVSVSLREGSLVVLAGNYVSFLAPSLHGRGLRFVGVSRWAAGADPYYTDAWSADSGVGPWRLGAEVRRLLRDHPGPVFVLLEDPDPSPTGEDYFGLDPQLVRAFDLQVDRASCRRVLNNLTRLGFLCQQR